MLGLVSCVLAAVIWVLLGVDAPDARARDALERNLAHSADPPMFSFTYQRGGTRALDCLLTNTRFTVEVDGITGEMTVRSLEPVRTIAMTKLEQVWLHRSLFERPPFDTKWLTFRRDASAATVAGVRRSLGVDLASTLLGDGLPPNGYRTVRAALDIADSVEEIGPLTIGRTVAAGFRLKVDAAQYADAARVPDESGLPTTASEPLPVIEAWVAPSGDVVRVQVRPANADGAIRAPEDGWRLDFAATAGVSARIPASPEATDAAAFNRNELRPSNKACRLPV